MAAYETYETDKDYDTMEMQNTQAAERVIFISIILVSRNVLNLKYLEWQFYASLLYFLKLFSRPL